VKGFMWSLGYNACLAVNCEGRSGGLALFWSMDYCVSLQSLCPNFIDVYVKHESGAFWRATFVYGEPRTENRALFWIGYGSLGPNGRGHGCALVISMKF